MRNFSAPAQAILLVLAVLSPVLAEPVDDIVATLPTGDDVAPPDPPQPPEAPPVPPVEPPVVEPPVDLPPVEPPVDVPPVEPPVDVPPVEPPVDLPPVEAPPTPEIPPEVPGEPPNPPEPPQPPPVPSVQELLRSQRPWARASVDPSFNGSEVAGNLTITGTSRAEPGFRVRDVNVWVDRQFVGKAKGTDAWSLTLDTRLLVDGPHVLRVAAVAAPEDLPLAPRTGGGDEIPFRTANHRGGVALYETRVEVTGTHGDAQVVPLTESHSGLRISLSSFAGIDLPPQVQVLVSYKETEDTDAPPTRTWAATYSPVNGTVVVSKPPHALLKAPGVLLIELEAVGQGIVMVRVEAVPQGL